MKLEDIKYSMLIKGSSVKSDQELRDDIISNVIQYYESVTNRIGYEIRTCGDIRLYIGAILNKEIDKDNSLFSINDISNIFMGCIDKGDIKHNVILLVEDEHPTGQVNNKMHGNSIKFIREYCAYMSNEDLQKLIEGIYNYEN